MFKLGEGQISKKNALRSFWMAPKLNKNKEYFWVNSKFQEKQPSHFPFFLLITPLNPKFLELFSLSSSRILIYLFSSH